MSLVIFYFFLSRVLVIFMAYVEISQSWVENCFFIELYQLVQSIELEKSQPSSWFNHGLFLVCYNLCCQ
jgi:hypothetical protein